MVMYESVFLSAFGIPMGIVCFILPGVRHLLNLNLARQPFVFSTLGFVFLLNRKKQSFLRIISHDLNDLLIGQLRLFFDPPS